MSRFLSSLSALALALVLSLGLSGCVSSGLASAGESPWQPVDIHTKSNPLDLAFTDSRHGFLVGSNRLILETDDGGASWQERALELPAEENFILLFIATFPVVLATIFKYWIFRYLNRVSPSAVATLRGMDGG